MRLTFLGTGAAEGYPNPFCGCENCVEARIIGGPSLRLRSAALIDDALLIDLGPDSGVASHWHRVPLTHIQSCLLTLAHADHFDPLNLLIRTHDYGVPDARSLSLYASAATLRRAASRFEADMIDWNLLEPAVAGKLDLTLHRVEPFSPFDAGGYRVTAYPANHDLGGDALLYAIQSNGCSIFYGTDTAVLSEEVWRAFHDQRVRFDVVVLDHTYGPGERGDDHLNAVQVAEHLARMRDEGLLADGARCFATHIAHAGNPPHAELAAYAVAHGYEVAFDGLVVEAS